MDEIDNNLNTDVQQHRSTDLSFEYSSNCKNSNQDYHMILFFKISRFK